MSLTFNTSTQDSGLLSVVISSTGSFTDTDVNIKLTTTDGAMCWISDCL